MPKRRLPRVLLTLAALVGLTVVLVVNDPQGAQGPNSRAGDLYIPESLDPISEDYAQFSVAELGNGLDQPGALDPSPDDDHIEGDQPDDDHGHEAPSGSIVAVTSPIPLDNETVYIIGFTWPSSESATVETRLMLDETNTWEPWHAVGTETPQGEEGAGQTGAEPLIAAGAWAIQVRVTADEDLSEVLEVHVIPADDPPHPPTSADAENAEALSTTSTVVGGALPTAVSNPAPTIHLRTVWGAQAPSGEFDVGIVRGAAVHHTAGVNSYSAADVPALLRAIQRYHMEGRGWLDIGYNFLVDKYGRVWEGRAGGVENTTQGAHSHSFNREMTGVSLMGNYQTAGVPAVALKGLVDLIAWKFTLHGVDARGAFVRGTTFYPTIIGHRNVPEASTSCPGTYLYALLPTIRSQVAARQGLGPATFTTDILGEGSPNLLGVDGDTITVLQPIPEDPDEDPPILGYVPYLDQTGLGTDMSSFWKHVASPSMEGLAGADIFAKGISDGVLWRFSERGTGAITTQNRYGVGWNRMSVVLTPGDFNRDGRADLVAISAVDGRLYFYAGDGRGGLGGARSIGQGWRNMTNAAIVGDLNGGGVVDMLAVQRDTGDLYFYPGTGQGSFGAFVRVSAGFAGFTEIAPVGDITGDGIPDVLLHNPDTGQTRTMVGAASGLHGGFIDWDGGWGDWRDPVGAPRWAGVTGYTLLAVDSTTGELVRPTPREGAGDVAVSDYGPSDVTLDVPGLVEAMVIGDVSGSSTADVIALDTEGDLYLYISRPDGFESPVLLATGMGGFTSLKPAGDFTLDGIPDLIAVTEQGEIVVLPVALDPDPHLGDPTTVARGFLGWTVYGVGAWGPGSRADAIAVSPAGQARLLVGRGLAWVNGSTLLGEGWGEDHLVPLGKPPFAPTNSLVRYDVDAGEATLAWASPNGAIGGTSPLTITLDENQHLGLSGRVVLPPAVDSDPSEPLPSLVIEGLGEGPGAGLSSYGSQARAESGHTHAQILTAYYPGTALQTRASEDVRVWLDDFAGDPVVLRAEDGLMLEAGALSVALPTDAGGEAVLRWRIGLTGTGVWRVEHETASGWAELDPQPSIPESDEIMIQAPDESIRVTWPDGVREYPGSLVLAEDPDSSGVLRVIAQVNSEDYLRVVLPTLVDGDSPAAALEAQAVASRTLVARLASLSTGWYDVCGASDCPTFPGSAAYNEAGSLTAVHTDARIDAAITTTAERVLTFEGDLALTPTTVSNGGVTADGGVPYLVAGQDPFDSFAPWSREIDIASIEATYPGIGSLERIRAVYDGDVPLEGRVIDVTITGTGGSVTVSGTDFQESFGLPSSLFLVRAGDDTASGRRAKDVNQDGRADLAFVTPTGAIRVYLGDSTMSMAALRTSGAGFGNFDYYAIMQDFEGPGSSGLLAIKGSVLRYYPFDAYGYITNGSVIPGNWSGLSSLSSLPDWNGPGTMAVLVKEASGGRVAVHPLLPSGELGPRQTITHGWAGYHRVMAAGDIDKDGLPDIFTADLSAGVVRLHRGTSTGAWDDTGQIVLSGMSGVDRFITSGDWNHDGDFDIVFRSASSGRVYLLPGQGDGTFGALVLLGRGFTTDYKVLN